MKKERKKFLRATRGLLPFKVRVQLARIYEQRVPAPLIPEELRKKGIDAEIGGRGECYKCGVHYTWLRIGDVVFPVDCCGVVWFDHLGRTTGKRIGG